MRAVEGSRDPPEHVRVQPAGEHEGHVRPHAIPRTVEGHPHRGSDEGAPVFGRARQTTVVCVGAEISEAW